MKLLVKFELKFLNFFTLKNLNNKKYIFYYQKNNYVQQSVVKLKCIFDFINCISWENTQRVCENFSTFLKMCEKTALYQVLKMLQIHTQGVH